MEKAGTNAGLGPKDRAMEIMPGIRARSLVKAYSGLHLPSPCNPGLTQEQRQALAHEVRGFERASSFCCLG